MPAKSVIIEWVNDKGAWDKKRLARSRAEQALITAKSMLPPKFKNVQWEVTLTLSHNAAVKKLNGKFRGKDKPTNVLSFPNWEGLKPPVDMSPLPLGEIIMAFETVEAEAAALKKPFAEHFTHLLIHGFLHLLGYDHITPGQARTMEGHEIRIMEALGYQNPYK